MGIIRSGHQKTNELINATTEIYASLFTEDDFVMDSNKALKVRDGTFLRDVDLNSLNDDQGGIATIVEEHLLEHFERLVQNKSRRLSISVKRKKHEELSPTEKKKNNKKKSDKTKTDDVKFSASKNGSV